MQKLVVDCTTGEWRMEDLTPEELAVHQRDTAAVAAAREQVQAEDAAKARRETDLEAMLTEWRTAKAARQQVTGGV